MIEPDAGRVLEVDQVVQGRHLLNPMTVTVWLLHLNEKMVGPRSPKKLRKKIFAKNSQIFFWINHAHKTTTTSKRATRLQRMFVAVHPDMMALWIFKECFCQERVCLVNASIQEERTQHCLERIRQGMTQVRRMAQIGTVSIQQVRVQANALKSV